MWIKDLTGMTKTDSDTIQKDKDDIQNVSSVPLSRSAPRINGV